MVNTVAKKTVAKKLAINAVNDGKAVGKTVMNLLKIPDRGEKISPRTGKK